MKVKDLSEENTKLKAENLKLKESFKQNDKEFLKMKEDLEKLKAADSALKAKDGDLQCKVAEVERKVSVLENSPYYHICVYQTYSNVKNANMPFDRELYFECNNCDEATFDLESGIYTNGWPGTYTVTWSLHSGMDHGDSGVQIFLRKNDENISESWHYSYYSGSSGQVIDQGKLFMIVMFD